MFAGHLFSLLEHYSLTFSVIQLERLERNYFAHKLAMNKNTFKKSLNHDTLINGSGEIRKINESG